MNQNESSAMETSAGRKPLLFLFIGIIFFFSGFSGLLYEVIWSRMMTLIFGSTTYAVSTVLGVFMFGLALGSRLCARYLHRIRNHVRFYAFLEIGIGLYAFVFLLLLHLLDRVHASIFPLIFDSPLLLNLTRIALSFILLLPPTTMMGATFPLLSQALTRSVHFVGRDVGALYFINTFGAALGTFASAFILIPNVGLDNAVYTAACLNIILGLAALLVIRMLHYSDAGPEPEPVPDPEKEAAVPVTAAQAYTVLMAFSLSGFLALVLEVAWTRAFILVFGTSVYAFATMLTAFLVGLSVGSAILGRYMDRIRNPVLIYCIIQALLAAAVLITTPIMGRMPLFFLDIYQPGETSWNGLVIFQFTMCFLIILPTTLLSGALFPLASRIFLAARNFRIGSAVGDVYAFNTVGGILGSLASGFLLIPALGVERTLLYGAAFGLLIAFTVFMVSTARRRSASLLLPGACIVLAVLAPFMRTWNPLIMNSGIYNYADDIKQSLAGKELSATEYLTNDKKLLFYREGPAATVSVIQATDTGNRFFRVNGKTDGGDGWDVISQVMVGVLPILYNDDPKDSFVLGLGTGVTLGAAAGYPFESIDCVEISPAVVDAAEYFTHVSGDPVKQENTELYVLDGRTWLMSMPRTYDVVICEPSNPWQTGNANLFTRDFYRRVSDRLKPGGVFCQWIPLYGNIIEDVKTLVHTFVTEFPHINVWIGSRGNDLLMVGSKEPLTLELEDIRTKMAIPEFARLLNRIRVTTAEELMSFFYADEDNIRAFLGDHERLNTDNFPVIEFSSPKYVLGQIPDAHIILQAFFNNYRMSLPPITDVEDLQAFRETSYTIHKLYLSSWGILR